MPQKVMKRDGKYVVTGPSGTKGTHDSAQDAYKQKYAIDVSEGLVPGVKPRKKRAKKRRLPFVKGKKREA